MWFNKALLMLKKAFRKSWQFVVGLLAAILAIFIASKREERRNRRLDEFIEKEADIIKRAHEEEISNVINAHDRFDKKIENAFKGRDQKLNDIMESKEGKVDNLLDESPEEITKRLSSATGIPEVE